MLEGQRHCTGREEQTLSSLLTLLLVVVNHDDQRRRYTTQQRLDTYQYFRPITRIFLLFVLHLRLVAF